MTENDLRREMIERLDSGKPASSADILRLLRENEDLEAEVAAKDRRIAELTAALEPFKKAADMSDELMKGRVPESASYYVRVGDLRKARAALQRTGSQAAPKSEIESTLRAGLDLCHYEIDRAINQAAPSEDGDDAADIALARRARWGIVDDGAGQR